MTTPIQFVQQARRIHRPDPKLPADHQDKRSEIPVERGKVELWLTGAIEEVDRIM